MQHKLPFPNSIRMNGDQLFETAEHYKQQANYLLKLAATYEHLAIEAWAKAEQAQTSMVTDPYLQTR